VAVPPPSPPPLLLLDAPLLPDPDVAGAPDVATLLDVVPGLGESELPPPPVPPPGVVDVPFVELPGFGVELLLFEPLEGLREPFEPWGVSSLFGELGEFVPQAAARIRDVTVRAAAKWVRMGQLLEVTFLGRGSTRGGRAYNGRRLAKPCTHGIKPGGSVVGQPFDSDGSPGRGVNAAKIGWANTRPAVSPDLPARSR